MQTGLASPVPWFPTCSTGVGSTGLYCTGDCGVVGQQGPRRCRKREGPGKEGETPSWGEGGGIVAEGGRTPWTPSGNRAALCDWYNQPAARGTFPFGCGTHRDNECIGGHALVQASESVRAMFASCCFSNVNRACTRVPLWVLGFLGAICSPLKRDFQRGCSWECPCQPLGFSGR